MRRELSTLLLSLLFFIPLAATQGQDVADNPEQFEGQKSHAHPPEKYFCEHDSKEPAHKCDCHRVATDLACEDEPVAPTCSVYCWEKAHFVPNENERGGGHWENSHCHCPILCDDPKKPSAGATPSNSSPVSQPGESGDPHALHHH